MQGRTIMFPAIPLSKREQLEKELRQEAWLDLSEKLSELFWDDPTAFADLCLFCRSRRHQIPELTFKKLRKLGFLEEPGELPDVTNEVVYMATTGNVPFWIS